jgi:hypothetical protein
VHFCFAKLGLRRYVVQEILVESSVKLKLEHDNEQDWGDGGEPHEGLKAVLEADGCVMVNRQPQPLMV